MYYISDPLKLFSVLTYSYTKNYGHARHENRPVYNLLVQRPSVGHLEFMRKWECGIKTDLTSSSEDFVNGKCVKIYKEAVIFYWHSRA